MLHCIHAEQRAGRVGRRQPGHAAAQQRPFRRIPCAHHRFDCDRSGLAAPGNPTIGGQRGRWRGAGTVWRDSLSAAAPGGRGDAADPGGAPGGGVDRGAAGSGLAPADVMVLSRRRANLMPLQEALRAVRVPAYLGETTALIDCCEVLDIVALLDVLVSPRHDLSLARVLRSPLFGLADDALIALATRRRAVSRSSFVLLQDAWPQRPCTARHRSLARAMEGWLDALPVHDALQAIYSRMTCWHATRRVPPKRNERRCWPICRP